MDESNSNAAEPEDRKGYAQKLSEAKAFTPVRGKGAYLPRWQQNPRHVGSIPTDDNVGLLLEHAGLVDIDLDIPEAHHMMRVFCDTDTLATGRGGEITHYFYAGQAPNVGYKNLKQFEDDDDNVLEVRHKGKMVLWEGSSHPDTGEAIQIMQDVLPKPLPDIKNIRLAATAALVAHVLKHRMATGRHDFSLALGGFLLRHLDRADVETVVEAAWMHVGGDVGAALRNVADTAENEGHTTGGPTLDTLVPGLPDKIRGYWGWKSEKGSAGDDLTRIGREMVEELFTDQFGQPYALMDGMSVPVSGLDSPLRVKYLKETGKTAGSDAVDRALKTLAAIARVDGEEHDLRTRWANVGGQIWYEIAPGKVYRIDASGWALDPNPPVRFRHVPNLKALPEPVPGGTVDDLKRFVKLDGRDLRLFVSLIASYPFEHIPRPILALIGLKGRGKTTRSLFPKRLMDEDGTDFVRPNEDILRKATHRGIVACDNQSGLAKGVSDLLCGLVTGTGDASRALYTNNEEFGFKVKRPVILNGINLASEQPDLLERSLIIEAPEIKPAQRITESVFWGDFERERGKLLGVVFDSISGILRHRVPLKESPRMADWAEIAAALYEFAGRS